MNKITEVGDEASQSVAGLEPQARRLFVKGIAGLGATLSSSSLLCAATSARGKARKAAAPGNQAPAAQSAWGPFAPSNSAGHYLQIESALNNCRGVADWCYAYALDPGGYPLPFAVGEMDDIRGSCMGLMPAVTAVSRCLVFAASARGRGLIGPLGTQNFPALSGVSAFRKLGMERKKLSTGLRSLGNGPVTLQGSISSNRTQRVTKNGSR